MHQSKILFQWKDSLIIDRVYEYERKKQILKDTRYNSSKEFIIFMNMMLDYMVQKYIKTRDKNKKQSIVKIRDPESNASPL
jgi:hypothetical protein